jgi:hypothetical protein
VHEPLVPQELFGRAHAVLAGRRGQGGQAKSTNRSLLSGLIVCTRCGRGFGQWSSTTYSRKRDRKTKYRYYVDRGYQTGGRSVCQQSAIPADALDEFILGHVRKVLLGAHQTAEQAVNEFVAMVRAAKDRPVDTMALSRELEGLTRRIQATVSMLADPEFTGLDELKVTLSILKGKRDRVQEALEKATPTRPALSEATLRAWAQERLEAMQEAAKKGPATPAARKLVQDVIQKIEIFPDERRGMVYLRPNLSEVFTSGSSTKGARGGARSTAEWRDAGWGAARTTHTQTAFWGGTQHGPACPSPRWGLLVLVRQPGAARSRCAPSLCPRLNPIGPAGAEEADTGRMPSRRARSRNENDDDCRERTLSLQRGAPRPPTRRPRQHGTRSDRTGCRVCPSRATRIGRRPAG